MSSHSVILLAHGAREPEWARPFHAIRDRLRSEGVRVELAYLELMEPSIGLAAQLLVAEGAKTITIVPLFLGQGKHLKRDLPGTIADLGRIHAGVMFRATAALGDEPEVLSAIISWVKRAAR
ncbi:MAG TPA: CbiX/SirB N-terminal domain-containing protein [Burkholderiales bacterium]|nr:CbiX/SirB N-terminal domain-containing protein [Burkholderiales bacterium]